MKKNTNTSLVFAFASWLFCSLLPTNTFAAFGDITIVAGGGTAPSVDDGQLATTFDARANNVEVDSQGNFYYSDSENHRIYKVNPQGILSIVAGTGTIGTSWANGDGGLAVNARLASPGDLALDSKDRLYFLESTPISIGHYDCIRTIDEAGIISTKLCTTDGGRFTGISFDRADNFYYSTRYKVYKRQGGISGTESSITPTNAERSEIKGLAGGEADTVYIAEKNRVVKDGPSNNYETVAGNNTEQPKFWLWPSPDGEQATSVSIIPKGIFVDNMGNLFISEFERFKIRKVDTQGIISTVAGNETYLIVAPLKTGDGGSATDAQLFRPTDVAVDAMGKIYIADMGNSSIRKVDNNIITTVAGVDSPLPFDSLIFTGDGDLAVNARLRTPSGAVSDSEGNLYIADSGNRRIRKIDTSGVITTIAGTGESAFNGDNILATNANITVAYPTIDNNGNLYFFDIGSFRIRKIDTAGYITTVVGNGTQNFTDDTDFGDATSISVDLGDIEVDREGNLYLLDRNRVLKVNASGQFTRIAGSNSGLNWAPEVEYSGNNGPAVDAIFHPISLAIDKHGNVLVGVTGGPNNSSEGHLLRINTAGIITSIEDNVAPDSLVVDNAGNIYFTRSRLDNYYNQGIISKINVAGTTSSIEMDISLINPKVVGTNNQGHLFVIELWGTPWIKQNLLYKVEVATEENVEPEAPKITPMYRLYYPGNGKHLLTDSEYEYNALASFGWKQENIAFYVYNSPTAIEEQTSVAWLRLYNKHSGQHHWTTSPEEYRVLGAQGWNQEGVTAYLFKTQVSNSMPLYRLYNRYSGAHHWTLDANEQRVLISLGWKDEGITGYVFQSAQ